MRGAAVSLLDYCLFNFELELISDTHVGDGSTAPLKELCCTSDSRKQAFDRLRQIAGEQGFEGTTRLLSRDKDRRPVIEATSLRGALRSALLEYDQELARKLLGYEDLTSRKTANPEDSGRLWIFGGKLTLLSEPGACERLPFWAPNEYSFIMTGNARDRDLGAVRHGMLYATEYLPAGLRFSYEVVFRGTRDEFEDMVPAFFDLLSSEGALEIGGQTGYGNGRVRVVDSAVDVEYHYYDVRVSGFGKPEHFSFTIGAGECQTSASTEKCSYYSLDLKCPGPFFIVDPSVDEQRGDGGSDEKIDHHVLHRARNEPYLSGKAVLQALRSAAARLELEEALEESGPGQFDYDNLALKADDPFRHVTRYEDVKTRTARLFGQPGWGKRVKVDSMSRMNSDELSYEAESIQLDSFTQAPIDGALLSFRADANVKFQVQVRFDGRRYPEGEEGTRDQDQAFLERVIGRATEDGLELGHSVGSGFGWFDVRERNL